MNRRILIIFILALAATGLQAIAASGAQKHKEPKQKEQKELAQKEKSKNKVKVFVSPAPKVHIHSATGGWRELEGSEQVGPVTVELQRGGKVVVGSGPGRVVITGWDRTTVEAKATGAGESLPIRVGKDDAQSRITVSLPAAHSNGGEMLEVRVPRYAEIEVVGSNRESDIEVADVDAAVNVGSGHGNVSAKSVGPLRISRINGDVAASAVKGLLVVRIMSGDVSAENIDGIVDIVATSGDAVVRRAQGDVRVTSASGDIEVSCAGGRADLNTASGDLSLVGIGGDINASTTSGDVDYRGVIRANGRYVLRSHSGEARMVIQPDAPGFTATLSSYNGEIETAFPIKLDSTLQGRSTNRRITGRFGDGQAQIQLDSFSGSVKILKGAADPAPECK